MTTRATFAAAAASTAAILAIAAQFHFAQANVSGPITDLAGRWSGAGTVTPASGPSESFKCVATYFPSQDGGRVQQNLRCNSTNYKLEAVSELQIRGNQVTGTWEDKSHALNGVVSGSVTEDGFDILLSGKFFRAQMVVASSRCEQSVTVTPAKADYIRELAASLKRC